MGKIKINDKEIKKHKNNKKIERKKEKGRKSTQNTDKKEQLQNDKETITIKKINQHKIL